jgi:hypothetical protein
MMAATVCQRRGVPVPPKNTLAGLRITKYILGRGRVETGQKKILVAHELTQRYRLGPFQCDDESDAVAVWLYGESMIAPQSASRRSAGPLFPVPIRPSLHLRQG